MKEIAYLQPGELRKNVSQIIKLLRIVLLSLVLLYRRYWQKLLPVVLVSAINSYILNLFFKKVLQLFQLHQRCYHF